MIFTTIVFWSIFIVFLLMLPMLRRLSPVAMMTYVVAFSLAVFAKANGMMTMILLGVALVTWLSARYMQKAQGKRRTIALAATIAADILPLLFFKYSVAISHLWSDMVHSNFSLSAIAVPVGISFFTFQAVSYAVDVYRRRFTQRLSMLEFLFYLTFFPTIFAGPITRAEVFFASFRRKGDSPTSPLLPISPTLLYTGMWLIMLGLIKKLAIADYISQYNDWIFDDPQGFTGLEVLMGVIGYSVQIYCDFSGYSDISIGIAALLGVSLPENFNFPYRSHNITEFWRRWHISLSTWFRDYLYIPLGGNRRGTLRTYLNLFVTMLVAGLWHGSTLMFLLWGAIHGIALILHKAVMAPLSRLPRRRLVSIVSWLLTYGFVMFAWVVFRSDDISACAAVFSQIFCHTDASYLLPFLSARSLWTVMIIIVLLSQMVHRDLHHRLIARYVRSSLAVKVVLFLIVVQICIELHSSSVQPFIYYKF